MFFWFRVKRSKTQLMVELKAKRLKRRSPIMALRAVRLFSPLILAAAVIASPTWGRTPGQEQDNHPAAQKDAATTRKAVRAEKKAAVAVMPFRHSDYASLLALVPDHQR
jgi:hypothetical protein